MSSSLSSVAIQEIALEKSTVDLKFESIERYETCREPLKSLNNDILTRALNGSSDVGHAAGELLNRWLDIKMRFAYIGGCRRGTSNSPRNPSSSPQATTLLECSSRTNA
jgi:hypothetical protein